MTTTVGRRLLVIGGVAVVLGALGVRRLQGYPYPLDPAAAWEGVRTTVGATLPAAMVTWSVLAVVLGALARWLRRATDLGRAEAVAGGVVLLWAWSYVALLGLGPLGLYRATVLRMLLAVVVTFALWRAARLPPAAPTARGDGGALLATLSVLLAVGPLFLLQLGSPVSPFMDVLPYVAPVQKIVTFEFFDPFGNDAAGLWAATRQVVGYDALFSTLALVTGLPAHLAITATIVPFVVLQVLALYLLGRVVGGGLAGGMASLFLLQTFLWRRTPDVRSTSLTFALVAIGLAFLLTARRGGTRAALGGLALGVGVAVSPLIGGVGMQVASLAAVVAWLDLGLSLTTPVLALAGGSLFALPQVLVGTGQQVPPLLMPLLAGSGVAVLVLCLRVPAREPRGWARPHALVRAAVIILLPVVVLWIHARRQSEFFNDTWFGYGMLLALAAGGLAVAAQQVWRHPATAVAAAVPALALWVGIADHAIADPLRFTGTLEMKSLASEVTPKMILYWAPYWLALAAGVWFAMLARRFAWTPAVVLALLLVVYPLRLVPEPLDFDGQQLSLAETWGFHLGNAARGYHAGRGDRRWVVGDEMRALTGILEAERRAGRIDYRTHVLQVSQALDVMEIALWTGISVDLITPQYDPKSIWTGNGRARNLDALPAAFARAPRYVVFEGFSPDRFQAYVSGYEKLYQTRSLALYRRVEPPSAGGAPGAGAPPAGAPATPVSEATT